MMGVIRTGPFKIAGPELLYRAEFVGILPACPGHIYLHSGQIRDELLSLSVSDDFIDVIVGYLGRFKIVFPRILYHVRENDENLLAFLIMEDDLGNIQGIENLRPLCPFLPG